jgi:hypothetical protein
MISKYRVGRAISEVPKQGDVRQSHWCCGPNSGLRAVYLLGSSWSHGWNRFCDSCPSSTEGVQTAAKVARVPVALGFGLMGILNPVAWFSSNARQGIRDVMDQVVGDKEENWVGPTVPQLAKYMSQKLSSRSAYYSGYSSQTEYEESIARDIGLGIPRTILLISGTFNMHYVNIIGAQRSGKYADRFVILDTDGTVGDISDSNLKYWMNRDGYAHCLVPARYNTIEYSLNN